MTLKKWNKIENVNEIKVQKIKLQFHKNERQIILTGIKEKNLTGILEKGLTRTREVILRGIWKSS